MTDPHSRVATPILMTGFDVAPAGFMKRSVSGPFHSIQNDFFFQSKPPWRLFHREDKWHKNDTYD